MTTKNIKTKYEEQFDTLRPNNIVVQISSIEAWHFFCESMISVLEGLKHEPLNLMGSPDTKELRRFANDITNSTIGEINKGIDQLIAQLREELK